MPLRAMALLCGRGAEWVFPCDGWLIRVAGMRHHRDERAAVHALPASFERNEVRGFAVDGGLAQALLHIKPDAHRDPHALLGEESAAAPPPQRRVIADIRPVKDAQLALVEFDDPVFLRFGALTGHISKARPVRA